MPQCSICNTGTWVGQRYCPTCDNYLPLPEEEDHLCPQCGIRVAPEQEICHKCKGTLVKIAVTAITAAGRARVLPTRVLGILIGTVLVILALFLVFLLNKSTGPSQVMVTPSPQAASEQAPAATPIPAAKAAASAPTTPAAQEPAVPSAPAIPSPPEVTTPTASPPVYFVNAPGLALRDGPTMSAPQISTLYLKDEVELLDTSGEWGKVRDMRRNIIGWSAMRFLQPMAADGSGIVPQHPSPKEQEPISSEDGKEK